MTPAKAIGAIVVILIAGAALAFVGSDGSVRTFGIPLFALGVAVAFVVQWIAFVPAWIASTEHYFDLTGSLTYLTLLLLALAFGPADPRAVLLAGLIGLWAVRLGTFLFTRTRAAGGDRRFTRLKASTPVFLMTWTLQGLWVSLTLACAFAAMTNVQPEPLGAFALAGGLLWIVGFAIEVAADSQKRKFRADPSNATAFITSGLWAWSRHPNYFGEIVLWTGIAIIALPALGGWQHATLISPVFVILLLTRISGVPLLENRARRAWGEDPAYVAYCERTPLIVPKRPG